MKKTNQRRQPEINWAKEADKAFKLASTELYEAHRGVIPWHSPTNMYLAFDNGAASVEQANDLWDELMSVSDDAPYVDYYEGGHIVGFYQGNDTDATDEVVLDLLWHCFWEHAAGSGSDQQKAMYEYVQRKAAAARLKRYWMETPNEWDQETLDNLAK